MSSNVLAFSRIQENKKNKQGKNWTNAELEAREKATEGLSRKKVNLVIPAWLKSENKKHALDVWNEITKQAREINLFDDVDSGCLATYCDLRAQYEAATVRSYPDVKAIDRLSKLLLAYAEKLGLTPTARARLALKRANGDIPKTDKEELFD